MPVCSRLVWKVCEELEKCFWRDEKVKEGQVRQVECLASMSELRVLRRKKKKTGTGVNWGLKVQTGTLMP